VELSLSRLARRGLRSANLAVMDGLESRILDSQIYASESGKRRTHSFPGGSGAGESRTYYILELRSGCRPQPIVKTYARQIGERYRDMAWESDRIAHRNVPPGLIPERTR